ncbi:hypothetical protein [Runella sp. SP2]|uniref:hypothetical protein n=1 Tax=Runella sp. SP2 TaxID=2268026 RepID=UPI000F07DF19|nr:hypothetical protein [Runella sp. SP2]AYQ33139.1 hypothetical protein DTQ70_13670 [Runella sp. SP2]
MAQLPVSSKPARSRTLILSLVAATIIWLFNELNKDGYTLRVPYPVKISYNDSLYISIHPLPRSANAIIKGSGWTLLRKSIAFTVPPVTYVIENPLATNSINTSALAAAMNEQVKDVDITHVELDKNRVDFEERVVKTSILKVDSLGLNLFPKFVVSSLINLRPNKVTFEGPASLVNDIADTLIVKVPAKKIRGNYDEELPIRYPQSPLLKTSAERVFVSFEVAEFLGTPPPPPQPKEQEPVKKATTKKASKGKKKK